MDTVPVILEGLRVILGFLMLFFVPGFILSLVIFPRFSDIGIIKRLAYSTVLSIGSVIALVLFMYVVLGMDTTPENINIVIGAFSCFAFFVWLCEVWYLNSHLKDRLEPLVSADYQELQRYYSREKNARRDRFRQDTSTVVVYHEHQQTGLNHINHSYLLDIGEAIDIQQVVENKLKVTDSVIIKPPYPKTRYFELAIREYKENELSLVDDLQVTPVLVKKKPDKKVLGIVVQRGPVDIIERIHKKTSISESEWIYSHDFHIFAIIHADDTLDQMIDRIIGKLDEITNSIKSGIHISSHAEDRQILKNAFDAVIEKPSVTPVKPLEIARQPDVQVGAEPRKSHRRPVVRAVPEPMETPQRPVVRTGAETPVIPERPVVLGGAELKEIPKRPVILAGAEPEEIQERPVVQVRAEPKESPRRPGVQAVPEPMETPQRPVVRTGAETPVIPKRPVVLGGAELKEIPKRPVIQAGAEPEEIQERPADTIEVPKRTFAGVGTETTELLKHPVIPVSAEPEEIPKQPVVQPFPQPKEIPKRPAEIIEVPKRTFAGVGTETIPILKHPVFQVGTEPKEIPQRPDVTREVPRRPVIQAGAEPKEIPQRPKVPIDIQPTVIDRRKLQKEILHDLNMFGITPDSFGKSNRNIENIKIPEKMDIKKHLADVEEEMKDLSWLYE